MPNALLDFASDPDQLSREAELRDFFGPNADKFLAAYRRLRPGPNRRGSFSVLGAGFNGAAFLTGPVWFFYRKYWNAAWIVVGLMIFFNIISYYVSGLALRGHFPLGVLLGLFANRLYILHATKKLNQMRAGSEGVLQPEQVRHAGGVSVTAAWISGIIYGLYVLLALFGILYIVMHVGDVPPSID